MPGRVISSTTQEFLDIYDITNNVVIMKDGSVSAILSVNAMNFSLLAEEEQDAVIYAYAALLNSLNYSIQINIQSKTKDATKYLELLKKQQEKASTRDKADRIGRYQQFVSKLIQERNVLDKKFYVVTPATPVEMGIMSPQSMLSGISGKNQFDISMIERSVILEKALGVLEPRVTHLEGQFNRIGLYARQLTTQEIIQIYYTNYNPEAAEGQQLVESSDYAMPMVRASVFNTSLKDLAQAVSPVVSESTTPDAAYVAAATETMAQTPSTPQTSQVDYSESPLTENPATTNQSVFVGVPTTAPQTEVPVASEPPAPLAEVAPDNSVTNQTQAATESVPVPTQTPANSQNYTLPPVAEIN